MNKKRTLVLALSIILLCMSLLISTTYALFSETIVIKNHLQAGFLDVSLVRTNLKYTILNEEGYLQEEEISENIDFSALKNESIFGIDSPSTLIVPGSYFEAELELRNQGNVAIEYVIKIVFNDEVNELAKQVKVKLIKDDGSEEIKTLDEILKNDFIISSDEMIVGEKTNKFSIRIEFINDVLENTYNGVIINNNLAQNKQTTFDLVVEAVQKTNK